MFAAQGAMVAFCNPQGSTGYGHALTRSISRHWSDACPEAILAFLDHVLAVYPQADPARLAAAGASFGGYMINWLLGHTDRFKAFVSHDGIFHTEMMAYETDELWFDEFEFGGAPYECPGSRRFGRLVRSGGRLAHVSCVSFGGLWLDFLSLNLSLNLSLTDDKDGICKEASKHSLKGFAVVRA